MSLFQLSLRLLDLWHDASGIFSFAMLEEHSLRWCTRWSKTTEAYVCMYTFFTLAWIMTSKSQVTMPSWSCRRTHTYLSLVDIQAAPLPLLLDSLVPIQGSLIKRYSDRYPTDQSEMLVLGQHFKFQIFL